MLITNVAGTLIANLALACGAPSIDQTPDPTATPAMLVSWQGEGDSYLLKYDLRGPDGAILQVDEFATNARTLRLRLRPHADAAKLSIELIARCTGGTSSEPVRHAWYVPAGTACASVDVVRYDPATHSLRWQDTPAGPFKIQALDAHLNGQTTIETPRARLELSADMARATQFMLVRHCAGTDSLPVVVILQN